MSRHPALGQRPAWLAQLLDRCLGPNAIRTGETVALDLLSRPDLPIDALPWASVLHALDLAFGARPWPGPRRVGWAVEEQIDRLPWQLLQRFGAAHWARWLSGGTRETRLLASRTRGRVEQSRREAEHADARPLPEHSSGGGPDARVPAEEPGRRPRGR